jgi:hypothetical protein
MATRKPRSTKSATVAQDAINAMLADASREDRKAQPPVTDQFPDLDDLVAQGAQLAPVVPKWKQRRIDFCRHYNVDMARLSVQNNGDLVNAFRKWNDAQDIREAEAMSA